MSDSTQQTTAVANALSGEKTFKTITFAITGNQIADCVAGLDAVLGDNGCDCQTKSGVLAMLSLVYERHQKLIDSRTQPFQTMGAISPELAASLPPPNMKDPWRKYPFPSGLGNAGTGQLP